MSNIENFLKSIYADNTNKMVYIYLALAAITALLIIVIIIVSIASNKKKNKIQEVKNEKEEIEAPKIIPKQEEVEESFPIIEETKPVIEPIDTKKTTVFNDAKSIIESIKEENYSSVYLDRKEVQETSSAEEFISTKEAVLKTEIEPDIMDVIGKADTISEEPINELVHEPEVVEEVELAPDKPEFEEKPVDLSIFELEAKNEEEIFKIEEPDLSSIPDFFDMNPIIPEEKPEEIPLKSEQQIVLSPEDLRANLAKLQAKTKPSDENELENILKRVGINDEEREIPNLANEESVILGK